MWRANGNTKSRDIDFDDDVSLGEDNIVRQYYYDDVPHVDDVQNIGVGDSYEDKPEKVYTSSSSERSAGSGSAGGGSIRVYEEDGNDEYSFEDVNTNQVVPASPSDVIQAISISNHNNDTNSPSASAAKNDIENKTFRTWVVGTPTTVGTPGSKASTSDNPLSQYLQTKTVTSIIDYYDDENVSISDIDKRQKSDVAKMRLMLFLFLLAMVGVGMIIVAAWGFLARHDAIQQQHQFTEPAVVPSNVGNSEGKDQQQDLPNIDDVPVAPVDTSTTTNANDQGADATSTSSTNPDTTDVDDEQLTGVLDARISSMGECCKNDRLKHNEKLNTGCFICSKNKKFIFGLNNDGNLIHHDVEHETTLYNFYQNDIEKDSTKFNDYFAMYEDGTWVVKRENKDQSSKNHNTQDEVLLSLTNKNQADIHVSDKCLDKYECPYLHLHQNGVLVLNWMNKDEWKTVNVQRLYHFEKN